MNNIDCISCNGKVEVHNIIITNVIIYTASIVSVPVLWRDLRAETIRQEKA
jgi:hypothetical protein